MNGAESRSREPSRYRRRLADGVLERLLGEASAVLINGPRAVGKTTTARQHANSVVRLDRTAEAAAFHADPDAALRGRSEPVLLDEWQEAPEVLGAVKRAVDDDPRPGRFLLTGSVRAGLSTNLWPGTGRLIRIRMFGLTERELRSPGVEDARPFMERVSTGRLDLAVFQRPEHPPDLRDYVERAVRGGFPAMVLSPGALSSTWADSYVEQLLTRDSGLLVGGRDVRKLGRYFEVLAAHSACVVDHKTLYDAAGIDRRTAEAYDHLLESLFLTEAIPTWSNSRLSTLTHTPKRYVVDGALTAAALGATAETVLADGNLLGRAIDTFVIAQLRSELALTVGRSRVLHLRTKNGREEVDIIIEAPGGRLVGLEVKASASPGRADARHLLWLRDRIGDRFVMGAVLHTGPDPYQLDDRIYALPIWTLWSEMQPRSTRQS